MFQFFPLMSLALALTLSACSGVETRTQDVSTFKAGNYSYYKWRSEPLSPATPSSDPIHLIDPIIRQAVSKELAAKGYTLDPERAQFSVDYVYAEGLRVSEPSNKVSSASTYPGTVPIRDMDQASIDNAIALAGVKETSNLGLQFNDVESNLEIWRVLATKVIERIDETYVGAMKKTIGIAVDHMLRPMPEAD